MRFLSDDRLGLEADESFRHQIHSWIGQQTSNDLPSWTQLLYSLPGIFPTEVLAALRRKSFHDSRSATYFRSILSEACKPPPFLRSEPTSSLPRFENVHLEHPLDFEWHFTDVAKSKLVAAATHVPTTDCGNILCIGCPSVFNYGNKQVPGSKFILWDKNVEAAGQIHEAEIISRIDLARDNISPIQVGTVILDPPWYNDYYRLFLWAAATALKPNGRVILSFPSPGTRTSAIRDREAFSKWAEKCGFVIRSIEASCLPYLTPLFESNALRASGIHNFPRDWRKADMIILEKVSEISLPRPKIDLNSNSWFEFQIDNVRIKINPTSQDDGWDMKSISQSAVLPSVSSRFPNRHLANVVTSGNRFLYTGRPDVLIAMCQKGTIVSDTLGDGSGRQALKKRLQWLLRQERSETRQYLDTFR